MRDAREQYKGANGVLEGIRVELVTPDKQVNPLDAKLLQADARRGSTEQGVATIEARCEPQMVGEHQIHTFIGEIHIGGSPFTFGPSPAAAAAHSSGRRPRARFTRTKATSSC